MNIIIVGDKPIRGEKTKGWVGARRINQRYDLVSNQISVLKKSLPSSKIVYIYGFDGKRAEHYFLDKNKSKNNIIAINNENYSIYGEMYSVAKARKYLDDDVLIVPGSLQLKKAMFKELDKTKNTIFIDSKERKKNLCCTINTSKNIIEHISYDLEYAINGMYYISKKNSHRFKQMTMDLKWRNFFVFEILNDMIESGIEFQPNPV